MPRPVPANSTPSLPILQKAPLPTEQLTQIQRRLAHLLNSLAELQNHVANAQTLEEWPSLLSRHLALASQTTSLTSFITQANPNALNTQLAQFNESITNEALQNNKFASTMPSSGEGQVKSQRDTKGDVLFAGTKAEDVNFSGSKLINVRYSDEKNPLRKIAPHPFFPLESEKSQMMLPALLLPKSDDTVSIDQDVEWRKWAKANNIPENKSAIKDHSKALKLVREQIKRHDEISGEAIRSFIHAKEATDELGQRYDWKLRLNLDELSEDEEEDEAEANEISSRKRKRDEEIKAAEENTLSLEQVSRLLSTGQM